jgi:hypothetical protein
MRWAGAGTVNDRARAKAAAIGARLGRVGVRVASRVRLGRCSLAGRPISQADVDIIVPA